MTLLVFPTASSEVVTGELSIGITSQLRGECKAQLAHWFSQIFPAENNVKCWNDLAHCDLINSQPPMFFYPFTTENPAFLHSQLLH